MGCVKPDGTLSSQAQSILDALGAGGDLDDVVRKTALPLYRVRAAIRELSEANIVHEVNGHYRVTVNEDGPGSGDPA